MDKKVAVIGGGIAGLTCAYRLAQKGIKSIVFEKEFVLGGRLQWSGVIAGAGLHPYTHALVKELGLEDIIVPLHLTDIGALMPNGSLLKMEDFPQMMKNLPPLDAAYMQKLGGLINQQLIDVKNIPQEIKDLKDLSFEDYMAGCPETLKQMLGFELNFRWIKSWKDISAEYGLICIAPFFTSIPREEMYTFEENMVILANVLTDKIKTAGSEVRTSTEVKKVEKEGEKFKIYFESEKGLRAEEVDKTVFALPLSAAGKIFPELDLQEEIKYLDGKCILARGMIKQQYDRKALFISPGHRSNVALIFATDTTEHKIYPLDLSKGIDLSDIYEKFEILDEKDLAPAWPIVPPKAQIPGLRTKVKGAFLCGDFYHFTSHDTSVATAEMVAAMITEKN